MLFFRSTFLALAMFMASLVNANHVIAEVPCDDGRRAHKVQCGLVDFFPRISASVAAGFKVDTTYYDLDDVQLNRLKNADLSIGGGVALAGNLVIDAGTVWQIGHGSGSNYHGIFGGVNAGVGASVGAGISAGLGAIGSIVGGLGATITGIFGGGFSGGQYGHGSSGSCDNRCRCKFALNYSQLLFPHCDVVEFSRGRYHDKPTYDKWRKCYNGLVSACGAHL